MKTSKHFKNIATYLTELWVRVGSVDVIVVSDRIIELEKDNKTLKIKI